MKKIPLIILMASTVVLAGTKVYAYDDDNSVNSIRYYGPSTCAVSDSTNRITYLSDNPNNSVLSEWLAKNYASVTSLSMEYGLPWEPILAQGAIESNFGNSEAYVQRGSIFALGPDGNSIAKDADYIDTESSWRVLFEYWRLNAGSNRGRLFTAEAFYDPQLYIDAIITSGYQTGNTNYAERLKTLTGEINALVERSGLNSSENILKASSAVEKNIERNRGEGVDSFGNMIDSSSTECNCGGDASASGVRWSSFWLANNSLFGSQKAPIIGTKAEKQLTAKDYGLKFSGDQRQIIFRIKNGNEAIVNGDPYTAYPNGDYPHFVVDIKKKRIFQYFPINLSAATKSDKNLDNGIVIDLVGYTEENGSSYYLWDVEKNGDSEWNYLSKLVEAIGEESGVSLVPPTEGVSAQIWEKISDNIDLSEHKAAIKCGTLEDSDSGLQEYEIRRFVNYYNRSVSLDDYRLPLNSKKMSTSFVAYFIDRFTTLDVNEKALGEPRDVVENLTKAYPMLETGNDPESYAVFASTDGEVLCGEARCGSVGVVLAIKNGLATTIEQSYPSGKLTVKNRSLADLRNSEYGVSFAYLRSVINEEELKLGKMGQ